MVIGGWPTHAPPILPTARRLRTRYTGSRVEFGAGLDDCEDKIACSHRSSKPEPSSLYRGRRYSDYSISTDVCRTNELNCT